MKRITIFSFFILLTFYSCQQTTENTAPTVSDQQKLSMQLGNAVLWYQQSAEMKAAYLQSYQYAKLLIQAKMDTLSENSNPAVVLDLDETVLDNSPYEARLIENGTTYASDTWKAWVMEAKAEALPGAKDFLLFAKEAGVEVFYISNRKAGTLQATIKNLEQLGLPNASAEYVQLRTDESDKTERRANVSKTHNIILFVGDNLTDYQELFAARDGQLGKDLVDEHKQALLNNFVMLPNPMYGEWEKAIYENDFGISDSMKLAKRLNILDKK